MAEPTATSSNVPASKIQPPRVAPVIQPARSRDQRPPSFSKLLRNGWITEVAFPQNNTALDTERANMREPDYREPYLQPSPATVRFAAQIAREAGVARGSGFHTKWDFVSLWSLRIALGVSILSGTSAITVLVVQKAKDSTDDSQSTVNQAILFWLVISIVFACLAGTTMLIIWARNRGYFSNLGARLGFDEVGHIDRIIRDDSLRRSREANDLESGLGDRMRAIHTGRGYNNLGSQDSLASVEPRDYDSPANSSARVEQYRLQELSIPPRSQLAHVRGESNFPSTSLRPKVPSALVHYNTTSNGNRLQPSFQRKTTTQVENQLRSNIPQPPVHHNTSSNTPRLALQQKNTTQLENPFQDPESPLEGLRMGLSNPTVRRAPEHVRQSIVAHKRVPSDELQRTVPQSINRQPNTKMKRVETFSSVEAQVDFKTERIEEHGEELMPRPQRRRNCTETAKDRTDAMLRSQEHDYSRGMADITAILNPKASASSLAGGKHLHPNALFGEGHSKSAPKQMKAMTSASSLSGAIGVVKEHFTEHHGRSLGDVIKATKAIKSGEHDKEAVDQMNPHASRVKNLDQTQEGAYREIFAKLGDE
ncbi:hypothetical protein BDZ45DRAFT_5883 [Acephala macrosclerotiorum]|nr:hypothetical protein BDZ45DRAFT_5883 [Acephala macrosclerotiorum]